MHPPCSTLAMERTRTVIEWHIASMLPACRIDPDGILGQLGKKGKRATSRIVDIIEIRFQRRSMRARSRRCTGWPDRESPGYCCAGDDSQPGGGLCRSVGGRARCIGVRHADGRHEPFDAGHVRAIDVRRRRAASPSSTTRGRRRFGAAAPANGGLSSMGMADFERIAMHRNPTLKQAAAQFEAVRAGRSRPGSIRIRRSATSRTRSGPSRSRSRRPTGLRSRGKPSPGDNVGGFVQWQIVTAGKLRLSRAKFAEEANAARWQAIYQELRVLNGVRIQFLEVLAAQRLIDIHRELVKLDGESLRTMREMVNVGQANEPELLQAQVPRASGTRGTAKRGEPIPRRLGGAGLHRRVRRRSGPC